MGATPVTYQRRGTPPGGGEAIEVAPSCSMTFWHAEPTLSITVCVLSPHVGDHVRYLPILVALLPVALQCVRDSNAEVAGMGRGTCLSSAAALTIRRTKGVVDPTDTAGPDDADPSGMMGGVLDAVLSACSSQASWRIRRGAAAVACVLQTRLNFVLTAEQHSAVDAALLSLLADPRREVQETARLAVSTRVAHLTAAETRVLCETFATGADSAAVSRRKRRKIAMRQAEAGAAAAAAVAAGETSAAMQAQQENVLGLSAVVLAAPCDVPAWVPGALESLARHANDESPGRLPVRQTVSKNETVVSVLAHFGPLSVFSILIKNVGIFGILSCFFSDKTRPICSCRVARSGCGSCAHRFTYTPKCLDREYRHGDETTGLIPIGR